MLAAIPTSTNLMRALYYAELLRSLELEPEIPVWMSMLEVTLLLSVAHLQVHSAATLAVNWVPLLTRTC
ncbi:hypothetical protein PhaeoP97_03670 (plasmid) [Phaeobacter porticola]|uniref:Uncharacterized protein n=1 Tax=Phaeobacter porticola TaxID=1844006 RepID=A0A1L3IAG2_9RHOB|nr:hypothetical protein PhaeoP97_03670 [Phaeobacter porticola]